MVLSQKLIFLKKYTFREWMTNFIHTSLERYFMGLQYWAPHKLSLVHSLMIYIGNPWPGGLESHSFLILNDESLLYNVLHLHDNNTCTNHLSNQCTYTNLFCNQWKISIAKYFVFRKQIWIN